MPGSVGGLEFWGAVSADGPERVALAALGVSLAAKAATVGLLTSLPMLFSGLAFARSFAAAPRKDAALGADLFGALLGALLQSVTFLTGVKALLLIVAALYLLAALTRPRAADATGPAPA